VIRRFFLVALAILLGGCVYYNGMYNARRLTDAAEKAEREGRTLDASTYWGQVTVKAETLLSRHPDSKYAPEAEFLLGRAQAELGVCERARTALASALPRLSDTAKVYEGNLILARCHAALGDHAAAIALLGTLIDRGPPAQRQEVRIALARSQRLAGRPAEAVASLEGIAERGILNERMLALAEAGRIEASVAVADSLIAVSDSMAPWDSMIAAVARHDAAAASRLVDRVLQVPGQDPELQARRLIDDANRAADPGRREARLQQAADVGRQGSASAIARFELLRLRMQRMQTRADLDSIAEAFSREEQASPLAGQIEPVRRVLENIQSADSLTSATSQGDLRLFLLAETARDVLHAPFFAAALFRRVAEIWPRSVYAPKALLAAERIDPQGQDLAALLEERYAGNPYVEAVNGGDPLALRALEDSLGAFAATTGAPRPVAPGRIGSDTNHARPAQRPRPTGGVPQP